MKAHSPLLHFTFCGFTFCGFTFLALLFPFAPQAQSLYFPPLAGNTWQTVSPSELGWCVDQLDSVYNFLEERNTKAFIILKDGRIAAERYFGTFTHDSLWYWASAGKVLTAFMVGQAQEDGMLNMQSPSSTYLGAGWTSLPPDKEALITVRHQLTMTTGLESDIPDLDCTLPACLQYRVDAGMRWFYHNAPYTLLTNVLQNATGQNLNPYFNAKIRNRIGMKGLWLQLGYNQVYFSDARSMARFGLMVLNKGAWATDTLLRDTAYFHAMINTSQNLNQSYGYLWWLNGKESYRLPVVPFQFPGPLIPNAPADLIAALGRDDQKLYVIPSLNMVVVRMGEPAGGASPALSSFDNTLWAKLMQVFCNVSASSEPIPALSFRVFPNPARSHAWIDLTDPSQSFEAVLHDRLGRPVLRQENRRELNLHNIPAGVYFLTVKQGARQSTRRLAVWHR